MSICSIADVTTFLGLNSTLTDKERAAITMFIPLAESALKDFVRGPVEQDTFTEFLPDRQTYGDEEIIGLDVVNNRVIEDTAGGLRKIHVRQAPIRTITTIHEDRSAYAGQGASDFAAATLLTSGTDYYADLDQSGLGRSGAIWKINGTWSSRPGTIKVVYTAGYTAAELDGTATAGIRAVGLKHAAIIAVIQAFKQAVENGSFTTAIQSGPLLSESISTTGHSVTYGGNSVTELFGLKVELPEASKRLAQPFVSYRR